ncbi:MAG: hypothetical protein LBM59_01665 [Ruminococcus sp.]|jgi:hypothetical protein|nr:hypothetical protein [Ruminococcus sp.]
MKIAKLSLAALLSLAMLTACGADTTTFGTVNGVEIPVGIYINYQYMAYNNALSKIAEKQAATTEAAEPAAPSLPLPGAEANTVTLPFMQDSIDGIPVRDYITEEAIEDVREYTAINDKFASLGLTYQNNEDREVKNYIDQNWEYFSETLTKLGISKASYEYVMLGSLKRQEVFMYYYGPGGEKAVPDEIIKEKLLEDNARINYIPMVLKDGEGNLLKSEGKAEQMKMAEDFVARAEAGENFDSLLAEYNDYYAALQAAATPADETETDDTATDEIDPNAETQTVTNEMVISKGDELPTAAVAARAFEEQAANPGETRYFIVEDAGGEFYYVVKLADLFSDPTYIDVNRETIISELYSTEFDETVKAWAAEQQVILNEKSIARYKVEKLEELNAE